MAEYDSDSSAEGEDIQTNVLLGYASQEPTGDDFSQLGGRPIWLNEKVAPSAAYAKCKVCNGVMSLLLQLNGDLPDWFLGHERRIYVFGCRRKACRRKIGSIRALRAVRASDVEDTAATEGEKANDTTISKPATSIGETLFGVKSQTPAQSNPFSSTASSTASANPFSSQKPAPTQSSTLAEAKPTNNLPETFAQKARVSSTSTSTSAPVVPSEPWQDDPTPYPSYYLDADKEYLVSEPETIPADAKLDTEGGSSTVAEERALFESAMDKTFQHFADRLAQNPEQVLRYEFAGQPLFYSKTDAIGKLLFSSTSDSKVQTSSARNGTATSGPLKIPRCTFCGATRVFELQLTPHAITELEKDDLSIDGMEWGTIIVGVCSQDCTEKGKIEGEVSYFEEWVGVQWEEIAEGMSK